MNKRSSFGVISVIALSMLAGCGKEETAPKGPAPAAAPAPNAAGDAQAQGKALANDAAAQGQAAVNTAVTQGQAAANDLTTLATQKLDEAVTYIKQNKVDVADKIGSELEGRKASLPAAIQQRLADVRKMVDTAKAANTSGVSVPKL